MLPCLCGMYLKQQVCVCELNAFYRHTHTHTFHRDVLDGKAQDDGPDHTKGHLHITVDNFCPDKRSKEENTDA